MTYVMGIDPSITATGVCLLYNDKEPKYVTCGSPKKLRSIDGGGDMPLGLRLWNLQCTVATRIERDSNPLLIGIETPISPLALGKFGGTGFNNNIMAYAMVYEMCGKFRIPYVQISTHQRAMIATGMGNSKKDEVVASYRSIIALRGDEHVASNDNEIDAYWLAMGAAEVWNGRDFKLEQKPFVPFRGWLDFSDKTYDMLETLTIERP